MDDYSHETFVTHTDLGVSLDPWAKKTREELKVRCGELSHALGRWQMMAMVLSEHGRAALSAEDRDDLDRLIEGYKD